MILTSSKEDRDIIEGYKQGANSYIVKPIDFHRFMYAMKLMGAYWAILSEPPHGAGVHNKAGCMQLRSF